MKPIATLVAGGIAASFARNRSQENSAVRPVRTLATVALTLTLAAAGAYAQERPLKMTFSGTGGPSTIDLHYPDTNTAEDNTAGNGALGSFTFRNVRAIKNSPEASSTCSGPTQVYFSSVAGAGVFRFQDGSLLKVNLKQAGDCIDFAARVAQCTMTFDIVGGTDRFKNASGSLTLTETVVPVLAEAAGNPVFFASEGDFTGTISGAKTEEERQDERR